MRTISVLVLLLVAACGQQVGDASAPAAAPAAEPVVPSPQPVVAPEPPDDLAVDDVFGDAGAVAPPVIPN